MLPIEPNNKNLLQKVLEPLLEDFQYWFTRTQTLLEQERLSFLSVQEQDDLLTRLKTAQQEVTTAKMMFHATGSEVGIDMATITPWHHLVEECWKVSFRWRSQNQKKL